MNFINKMERKFGKYAIHNLMYYVIILQIAGIVLLNFATEFTARYLLLDIDKVLHGQVWRILTFIIIDPTGGSLGNPINPVNVLFIAITLYLYYMIGRSLENVWGAFKFNLYYLSGILFNVLAAFILNAVFGYGFVYPYGLYYVNMSLFLMFAFMFPDMQLLYMFIIPIKMKWFGILYGVLIGKDVIECIYNGITQPLYRTANFAQAVAIIVALLNFIIMFLASRRNYRRISPQRIRRERQYKQQVHDARSTTRHRCAVCGRTEQDDPMLEFRYCSKCDGNYEYCMEHLFTHEHVKKH